MYARFLIIFLALIGIESADAPTRPIPSHAAEVSVIESRVLEVSGNFNRAYLGQGNVQTVGAAEEDITIFTPAKAYRVEGIADGRKEYEYGLLMGNERDVSFQGMRPKVQMYSGVAVVTFFARVSFKREGLSHTERWQITDVLVNRSGSWNVAHLHVSIAP